MLNETIHPEAEDLTATIFNIAANDEASRNYDALENWGSHLGEEAKADLYSLIEEAGLSELGRVRGVQAVSRCLWINAQRFPRG